MIWTRRSFLIAAATIAGGLAVSIAPSLPVLAPSGRRLSPYSDVTLVLLWLSAWHDSLGSQRLTVGVDRFVLLSEWVAPGARCVVDIAGAIVLPPGHALVNHSETDLHVHAAFTEMDGRRAWSVLDGVVNPLTNARTFTPVVSLWQPNRGRA